MDALLNDFRYAARRLRHTPAFTFIVVATLALGIGANSAIFSVVNTVLLRPLPYRDPGQLVTIFHWYPSIKLQASVSAPGFKDYRDRTHSFSNVAVQSGWAVNLTGLGEPQRLGGAKVSGRMFATLGIPAALGRGVLDDDDQAGHDHVVVLSDALWRRTFGARADIIGQKVSLNSESYQVIGVMPPGFVDPFNPLNEIWSPIAIDPARFDPNRGYTNEYLNLVARVKPGLTVDAAAKEMTAFAEQLKKDYPNNFSPDWTLQVKSMDEVQTGKIRPALLLLLGAVGFVLLIACANVANLLLARAASRHREIAIRTALGAKRSDLIRQLLAESLLLSLSGGAFGLAIAYGSIKALAATNPSRLPRVDQLSIDSHVVVFTLAIAVLTGVVFGLVPALQAWKGNLQSSIKDGSRGGTADRSGQLVRRGLVIAEIALALTLLTGGGLLLKSFSRLSSVNPGFEPRNVLTFGLALPAAKYSGDTARAAFWAAVIPRIQQVPGVRAAGSTSVIPFGGGWSTSSFNIEGYTPPPKANGPWGDIRIVTPGFFNTMQIPLLKGRVFTTHDDDHALQVAVVDAEFAKRYFKGADPIGKRFYFGNATPDTSTRFITIIGVVGHAAHEGLDAEPRIQYYFSALQPATSGGGLAGANVVVRTTGDPEKYVAQVRAAVHDIDHDLPMSRVTTMEDLVSTSMGQRRLSTILLGVFAGLALLLASLGIYGVMSYAVAQRTRELGVRVALGASRENVLGLVLKQGVSLTVIGAVAGLAGAFALTRLIATQLYDTKPTDPVTFAGVTVLLLGVALAATLVPALRAMRVDPIVALREE